MTEQDPVPSLPLDAVRLERYVLGLLEEVDCEIVEARAFADPAVAAAIDLVETDLADAHVAGVLTGERGTAFARALAERPRLRARVATARALAARRPATTIPRWWLPMLAAASVLVVAGVWMLRQVTPHPGGSPVSASREVDPAPAPAGGVPASPDLTVARAPEPSPPLNDAEAPAVPRAPVTFAVLLPVGGTRATAPTEVTIPASATRVALRVPVAPGDDFAYFRLRLRDATGRLVQEATAARLPRDRVLQVVVDRAALADGTYDVELEGRPEGGPFEPLAFLQIRLTLAPAAR